jgi:hypothetical protein
MIVLTTAVRCVHAYTLHYTTVTAKDSQCFGPDGERHYSADSVRKSWILQKKVASDWWRMRRGKCPPVPTTPEPECAWDPSKNTLLQRVLDAASEHKESHFYLHCYTAAIEAVAVFVTTVIGAVITHLED